MVMRTTHVQSTTGTMPHSIAAIIHSQPDALAAMCAMYRTRTHHGRHGVLQPADQPFEHARKAAPRRVGASVPHGKTRPRHEPHAARKTLRMRMDSGDSGILAAAPGFGHAANRVGRRVAACKWIVLFISVHPCPRCNPDAQVEIRVRALLDSPTHTVLVYLQMPQPTTNCGHNPHPMSNTGSVVSTNTSPNIPSLQYGLARL